jgi:simple sugar transport system substrate-binding protein
MNRKSFSRRDFLKGGGVGLTGAALLGVAGCGEGQEGAGAAGLTSRGDIRIEMPTHMVPPDPNTAIMQNGAEQASRDMGVEVQFRGPDQFSIPQIQQIFEASIAAEPDGIAATMPDPNALGPLVEKAVDQDIPVVLFNAGLDVWEELGALTYIGQTEFEAGVEAGKRMADAGVKNALCFNQLQGQLVLDLRCRGFDKGVGGTTKQIAVEGADPVEMLSQMKTALRQDPEVDGVLTLAPEPGRVALRAVREEGRQDSVQVGTFDISPEVLKAVQNGDLLFGIDQQMFLQTYASAVTLVTYIQYRLRPVTAVPTGPLFVTKDDAQEILTLSGEGIH